MNTDVDKLLTTENQMVLEKSRKDLSPSVYTTGQSVLIRIEHLKMISNSKTLPIDFFNLRIAKVLLLPHPNNVINQFYIYNIERLWIVHLIWELRASAVAS